MKMLAAVTVVLLPGIAVSSLFSMPLFDWGAERSDKLTNRRFWVYWAVTIPLTSLVIAVMLLWGHRKILLNRKQDKKAQEQLFLELSETR